MPTVMTENTVEQTWRSRQKAKLPVMRPLPLENGARLSRVEFERRCEAMPHVKKAELIEGVVYVPSPIRSSHSEAHGDVIIWLGAYRIATPGIHLNDHATLRLDMDSEMLVTERRVEMIPQVQTLLNTAAEELGLSQDDLVVRGLRRFLEQQLRQVQAEIFRISGHYGVSGVEAMEDRYREGTLEEAHSWQDLQRLDHLEYKRDRLLQLIETLP